MLMIRFTTLLCEREVTDRKQARIIENDKRTQTERSYSRLRLRQPFLSACLHEISQSKYNRTNTVANTSDPGPTHLNANLHLPQQPTPELIPHPASSTRSVY